MKRAFLYPGQGSQSLGMGIDVVDSFPEALAVFDCASSLAGYDMYELCAEGPMEKLSQTRYTQPALYTVEAAITDVMKSRGVTPDFAAGHSLGEFSAWYAACVYSFEDGFRLVAERGRLMNDADPDGRGAMSAVIGLSPEVIEEVCREVEGTVVVANLNSPLQTVISGERRAVEEAGSILKEKGAKRVVPLKVSGAFHSPLMAEVQEEFSWVVEDTPLSDAEIPVYSNVTAEPVTDADEIRSLMVRQLTSPVRWTEIIGKLVKKGVCESYELGPGTVIAGLVKRMDDAMNVVSISDASGISEVTSG